MNVYFDRGFRQRNALTADRFGGVTEMPLFSDTIEHGSTSVDAKPVEFTAHGRDRGFATRNSTQESITRTHYDECLMRTASGFPRAHIAWAFHAR